MARDSAQERWLLQGWDGLVRDKVGADEVDVRIQLDGDVADPVVGERLGVLLLQLGPAVRVVSPEELRSAAGPVTRRLLELQRGCAVYQVLGSRCTRSR